VYDLMFCWVGYQDVVKVKYRLLNSNIVVEFLLSVRAQNGGGIPAALSRKGGRSQWLVLGELCVAPN
jgi:hypothetical protein